MKNQHGFLTKTSFNDLLGSNEEDLQNQNAILTLTSLNGLLGFNKQDRQNKNKYPYFD